MPHIFRQLRDRIVRDVRFRFHLVWATTLLVMAMWPALMLWCCGIPDGVRWSLNQLTYSFFHLIVVPVAAAYFSVIVERWWPVIGEPFALGARILLTIGVFAALGYAVVELASRPHLSPYMVKNPAVFAAELEVRQRWQDYADWRRENPKAPDRKEKQAFDAALDAYKPFFPTGLPRLQKQAAIKINVNPFVLPAGANIMPYANSWTTFLVLVVVAFAISGLVAITVRWVHDLIQARRHAPPDARTVCSCNCWSPYVLIGLFLVWLPCRVYADWYETYYLVLNAPTPVSTITIAAACIYIAVMAVASVPLLIIAVRQFRLEDIPRWKKAVTAVTAAVLPAGGITAAVAGLGGMGEKLFDLMASVLSDPVGQSAIVFGGIVIGLGLMSCFEILVSSYWRLEAVIADAPTLRALRDCRIYTVAGLCRRTRGDILDCSGVAHGRIQAIEAALLKAGWRCDRADDGSLNGHSPT